MQGFHPIVTVLADDISYDVNADGTYVKTEVESIRFDSEQGVKEFSQIPLSYSTSLQTLDVDEAYTTTKDGRRIDVSPDKILVQQSRESADAPMFDDGKVKTVVFPGIEIGATATLRYRETQKRAMFPGQFSLFETFDDDIARASSHLTVRAPASLKLFVDAVDMQGGRVSGSDPRQQVWQWSRGDTPAHVPELGSVSTTDHSPRVAVTTFPNFAAVGAAYLRRSAAKAVVTPTVRKLADTLTEGVSDPRQQAVILYDWVSTHIRYVAIYLDFGGVVPHDADTILAAEYGDCKDHATVLEALLAAKGIRSSPVLVNAGSTYSLPAVAAPLGVFDHAITYLPDFKVFVDSTASDAQFGSLPRSELGKSALVADDGSGHAGILQLPLGNPDTVRSQVTTRITLDNDGNVEGSSEVSNTGTFDWMTRSIFASLPPGVESQIASKVLLMSGENGTGTYLHGDVRDLDHPFVYRTEFELPGYANFPGPGAIQVPVGLRSFNGIDTAFDQCGPKTRDFAIPVIGRQVSEITVITLPAGIKVSTMPKPVNLVTTLGTYSSTYVKSGQTITVTRELDLSPRSPLVEPAQYAEFRKMALMVRHDLRAQLIF